MNYAVETTEEVTDEMVEQLIDSAGYGIGYWAVLARNDTEAKTYTVKDGTGEVTVHVLTYKNLAEALVRVSRGGMVNRYYTEAAAHSVRDSDPDIDSDLADIVVQVALFGEVVYG